MLKYNRTDILAAQAIAARVFRIEPETGEIYWSDDGERAEVLHPAGYGRVQVYRRPQTYAMAHRVIWIAVHGLMPAALQINHINKRRWDNRIANLELVTPFGNARHSHGRPYDAIGPLGNVDAAWLARLDPGDRPIHPDPDNDVASLIRKPPGALRRPPSIASVRANPNLFI